MRFWSSAVKIESCPISNHPTTWEYYSEMSLSLTAMLFGTRQFTVMGVGGRGVRCKRVTLGQLWKRWTQDVCEQCGIAPGKKQILASPVASPLLADLSIPQCVLGLWLTHVSKQLDTPFSHWKKVTMNGLVKNCGKATSIGLGSIVYISI